MTWSIPAKTFLIGEYAAIEGASAIILTTTPCFKVRLSANPGLHGIHRDSPAGRFWAREGRPGIGLTWSDPYEGCGGLGASSAQFLGVYLASKHLQETKSSRVELMSYYFEYAWDGVGSRPSGYDVLAQSQHRCVHINRQKNICQAVDWPFSDMAYILLHTGKKLATHQHLQTLALPSQIHQLSSTADQARIAFLSRDSQLLIDAVNDYHHQLMSMNLIAQHSLGQIKSLQEHPDIVAVKGCGALGADVLLVLIPTEKQATILQLLQRRGWAILATTNDLFMDYPLMPSSNNERGCSK